MTCATLNRLGASVEQLTSRIESMERTASGNETSISQMFGQLNASGIAQRKLTKEIAEMADRHGDVAHDPAPDVVRRTGQETRTPTTHLRSPGLETVHSTAWTTVAQGEQRHAIAAGERYSQRESERHPGGSDHFRTEAGRILAQERQFEKRLDDVQRIYIYVEYRDSQPDPADPTNLLDFKRKAFITSIMYEFRDGLTGEDGIPVCTIGGQRVIEMLS